MKKMDSASILAGMLIAAMAIFCIASNSDNTTPGRYSVSLGTSTTPGTFIVCVADTATGKFALERCVEQIPATSSMMTPIGTFRNPLIDKVDQLNQRLPE